MPILVFIAYAHEDEILRRQLEQHLGILKRQGFITIWYDRKIDGGQELDGEIATHLNAAQIILPLISSAFLDSDYCTREMTRAMERHKSGEARVIPVILRICDWQNAPFGKLLALPTDGKAIVSWDDKDQAFKNVADNIRLVVNKLNSQPTRIISLSSVGSDQPYMEATSTSVINKAPVQEPTISESMASYTDEIVRLAPIFNEQDSKDDMLVQALKRTMPVIQAFTTTVKSISALNAFEPARIVYKSFDKILTRYTFPRDSSGVWNTTNSEFYKFIGHELFVTLFSFLVCDERWTLIQRLLQEGIFVDNAGRGEAESVPYYYVSQPVRLLNTQSEKGRLISGHSNLLNLRHSEGDLKDLVLAKEFRQADYFLFLRSVLHKDNIYPEWRPWSLLHMPTNEVPKFLIEAKFAGYASNLLNPFQILDIEALRQGVNASKGYLQKLFGDPLFFDPLRFFDANQIGKQ